MEYNISLPDGVIKLQHDNFESIINVDDLTTINTSNLFGEAVTISAAVNRIGLLKSEVEGSVASLKLELKIFEGNFRNKLRKEAYKNSGSYTVRIENEDVKVKLTEKALESCFETEQEWIILREKLNKAEKNLGAISSLYWSTQDKSRKLQGLVSGTTPEEFMAGVIEGKINGILISKHKS